MAAAALGGCSWNSPPNAAAVDPNIYPADYRAKLLDFLQNYLVDATNIRDAYVTEPMLKPVGSESRYVVCVRYNARDGNGHYNGSTEKMIYYFAGNRNQFVDATKEICGNAPYQPFPELQALKHL